MLIASLCCIGCSWMARGQSRPMQESCCSLQSSQAIPWKMGMHPHFVISAESHPKVTAYQARVPCSECPGCPIVSAWVVTGLVAAGHGRRCAGSGVGDAASTAEQCISIMAVVKVGAQSVEGTAAGGGGGGSETATGSRLSSFVQLQPRKGTCPGLVCNRLHYHSLCAWAFRRAR